MKMMNIKKIFAVLILVFINQYANPVFSQPKYIEDKVLKIQKAKAAAKAAKQEIYNSIIETPVRPPAIYTGRVENKEDYALVADELIEIYEYYPGLWFYFLFLRRDYLNPKQIEGARILLRDRLTKDKPHYHELIYYYRLTHTIPALERSLDSNLLDTIQSFVEVEKRIPDEFLKQLRNMTTLANLGNQRYENELLSLVKTVYKKMEDKHGLKEYNKIRSILYKYIIPHTLIGLYSKNSAMETLYLLEDPFTTPPTDHMNGINYSKRYYTDYLLRRIYDIRLPKSFLGNTHITDVEKWKEVLSNDDLWRPIVNY